MIVKPPDVQPLPALAYAREELHGVGVGPDDLIQHFLVRRHRVKRNALIRLREANYFRLIFIGQKSFGNHPEFPSRARQQQHPNHHHRHAMPHRPSQRHFVRTQHSGEHPFQRVVHSAVLFADMRFQEPAAQHGRQCQRHKPGNQNRRNNHHREFMQQPP